MLSSPASRPPLLLSSLGHDVPSVNVDSGFASLIGIIRSHIRSPVGSGIRSMYPPLYCGSSLPPYRPTSTSHITKPQRDLFASHHIASTSASTQSHALSICGGKMGVVIVDDSGRKLGQERLRRGLWDKLEGAVRVLVQQTATACVLKA
ncbi:hypothetical protein BDQ17DRAFT_1426787 [Cyathus striatus]|nr:hypothetical protein BDQ17DRAFT_1426787 [Cyathus striatus]